MTPQPINTHHILPTCFGHFQGCALKRMDKSKYFNSFILCNAPPCRWPHEWPKHVKGYGMYDVLSSTYVHLLVLLPYLIAEYTVMDYLNFLLCIFIAPVFPIALKRMHSQNISS